MGLSGGHVVPGGFTSRYLTPTHEYLPEAIRLVSEGSCYGCRRRLTRSSLFPGWGTTWPSPVPPEGWQVHVGCHASTYQRVIDAILFMCSDPGSRVDLEWQTAEVRHAARLGRDGWWPEDLL